MFDAAFDDWNHKKFGTTTSIRNIIKVAAMAVHSIPKETSAKDLRKLLDDKNVVSPPQWFQAMLAQGVLLLNTALTTGGDMDPSVHASFWRPIIETIIETILQAQSESTEKDADTRKGIVFLWWGCIAMKTKRKMNAILRKYENEVDIRHLEWWNPAAQGDKFCNDPKHFVEVNKCITSMGMKPINWLPNHSWFTNPNSILSGMGDFITDTRKLHSMYMERLSSGLECEQNLPPITGIRSKDSKGFVDACAPIGLASEALHILETVKTMENKALTDDEKGALYLYTGHCIYARLNKILRSPNRANLRSYYSYLLLFLHAYDKLKKRCENQILYRGIDKDLTISYGTRSKVIWWSISSCSSDRDIAEGFANCGTLFHVRTTTAVPIMDYSACGDEDEYILAPGTQLKVMKVVRRGKGLSEIFLEEMKASELVT